MRNAASIGSRLVTCQRRLVNNQHQCYYHHHHQQQPQQQQDMSGPYAPPLSPPFPSSSRLSSRKTVVVARVARWLTTESIQVKNETEAEAKERNQIDGKGKQKENLPWTASPPNPSEAKRNEKRETLVSCFSPIQQQEQEQQDHVTPCWAQLSTVLATYPHLTNDQAQFLIELRKQIEGPCKSESFSQLFHWYLETIWHQDRIQQHSADHMSLTSVESGDSLSLLMRFAFKRSDVKSLCRIEARAEKTKSQGIWSPDQYDFENGRSPHSFLIWPIAVNPLSLGFNLKLSLACQENKWDIVNKLLDELETLNKDTLPTRLSKLRSFKRNPIVSSSAAAAAAAKTMLGLDDFGFNVLVRYGIGDPASMRVDDETDNPVRSRLSQSKTITRSFLQQQDKIKAMQKTLRNPINGELRKRDTMDVENVFERETYQDEMEIYQDEMKTYKIDKETYRTEMEKEKRKVAQRILPSLVSRIDRELNQSKSKLVSPTWLLVSTLNQLADTGQSEKVIGMITSYLEQLGGKHRFSSDHDDGIFKSNTCLSFPVNQPLTPAFSTTLLNIALRSKTNKPNKPNLSSVSKIFYRFTGINPLKICRSSSGYQPLSLPISSSSSSTTTNTFSFIPNEQSLFYLFKSLSSPINQSIWSFRLLFFFSSHFTLTTKTYYKVFSLSLSSKSSTRIITKTLFHFLQNYHPPSSNLITGMDRFFWNLILQKLKKHGHLSRGDVLFFYKLQSIDLDESLRLNRIRKLQDKIDQKTELFKQNQRKQAQEQQRLKESEQVGQSKDEQPKQEQQQDKQQQQ